MKKASVLIRHCFSFLCVILERSEESRCLFFGLFFVSFRAAAAKNPASVFSSVQHSSKIGIHRSADSALNDTKKSLALNDTKRRNLESRRALDRALTFILSLTGRGDRISSAP